MASVREQVTQTIEKLSDAEIQLVAEYLSFLKFRARTQVISPPNEIIDFAQYLINQEESEELLRVQNS